MGERVASQRPTSLTVITRRRRREGGTRLRVSPAQQSASEGESTTRRETTTEEEHNTPTRLRRAEKPSKTRQVANPEGRRRRKQRGAQEGEGRLRCGIPSSAFYSRIHVAGLPLASSVRPVVATALPTMTRRGADVADKWTTPTHPAGHPPRCLPHTGDRPRQRQVGQSSHLGGPRSALRSARGRTFRPREVRLFARVSAPTLGLHRCTCQQPLLWPPIAAPHSTLLPLAVCSVGTEFGGIWPVGVVGWCTWRWVCGCAHWWPFALRLAGSAQVG